MTSRGGIVRWGMLSTAGIGRVAASAIRGSSEAEFVAVAGRDAGKAAAYAAELGVPRSFGSYDELLACDEVDAIYVPLPIALHTEWTIKALQAGKHVLCEKPFAMTAADAAACFDAAKAAGRHCIEGLMWRHHPQTLLAQQLIADGAIGDVAFIRAALTVSVDPGDIRRTGRLGGGASLDLGCYCISAIRLFGGEPSSVSAAQVVDTAAPGADDGDLRLAATFALPGNALAQLDVALDYPRRDELEIVGTAGVETVEIGLGGTHGGWSPAPHADLVELLTDTGARDTLRHDITSRGLRLEAFNAAGNPLHPVEGDRDDRVLRGALQLAEEFEVGTVVTMSGLPAKPGDTFPAWITTVWPPENLQLLEHQWTVAVDYWGDLAEEARRRGVKIAIEMHANQLVYSVPGLLKLRDAVGDRVGANFDPSHLLWMGADPLTATGALEGPSTTSTPKDTRIETRAAVASRLETIPNERTDERAWNYVAVGTGHPDGVAFWTRFADALQAAGYDGPLSIENEDYTLGQRESVATAVDTLRQALAASPDRAGPAR